MARFVSIQEEISEDDIEDSFKALFAQLAGEVGELNRSEF